MIVPTFLVKAFWNCATFIGTRRLTYIIAKCPLLSQYKDTIFYFPPSPPASTVVIPDEVSSPRHLQEQLRRRRGAGDGTTTERRRPNRKKLVALTIDDGLCRGDDATAASHPARRAAASLVPAVLDTLDRYDATATFFVCTKYTVTDDVVIEQAKELLSRGHEIGNHLEEDLSGHYSQMTSEEFGLVLDETDKALAEKLRRRVTDGDDEPSMTKWFRAPQGVLTKRMSVEVEKRGMVHVLGDCYCDDWLVEDSEFVARTMLRQARDGSVLILHMPEKCFREHCLVTLELLLEGLSERGMRCVSLGEMMKLRCANSK